MNTFNALMAIYKCKLTSCSNLEQMLPELILQFGKKYKRKC